MYPLRGKPQHRVERLILKTHPSRPPIQCATHRGCFTTFILFCGCVYGWILTTLLLLSVALLLKVTLHHYVYLLGSKPQWSAVVKAIDQSKWLPLQCQTHMSVSQPAYAVDVQWMSPYHLTACSCRPCFCKLPIFLGTSRGANNSLAWWLRPFKWPPTSMPDTYKVFHTLHMLWMCIWVNPYHVTAPLVGHAFGS